MFHSCIQLLTEVLKLDVKHIAIHNKKNTLLHIAAYAVNFEAVEYLLGKVPTKLQSVLEKCVETSYNNDSDMLMRRENILYLLLNKNPSLIKETPNSLVTFGIDLGFFRILIKFGAKLSVVILYGNCAMLAGMYMSPSDYFELVKLLLTDYKAEYLFVENGNWKDPLPHIIQWATLLPST